MRRKTLRSGDSPLKTALRRNRKTIGTAPAPMTKISKNPRTACPELTGNACRGNSIPCSGSVVTARCGGR